MELCKLHVLADATLWVSRLIGDLDSVRGRRIVVTYRPHRRLGFFGAL